MMTVTTGASLAFARSLFTRGTDLFGVEEIKAVFGLDVTVPPIPWSEQELAQTRERGEILVYQPVGITMKRIHEMRGNKTSDGKPLFYDIGWYKEEAFFTEDALRPGWRLVSREVIPASRNKNYVKQTEILIGEIAAIYYGSEMPMALRQAIHHFEKEKAALTKLISSDWKEAARQLTELAVNVEFREKPVEALWSLALYEGVNHEHLLPSGSWSWTNKLSSDGGVVRVGGFGEGGAGVDRDFPRYGGGSLGFRLSRSGSLE